MEVENRYTLWVQPETPAGHPWKILLDEIGIEMRQLISMLLRKSKVLTSEIDVEQKKGLIFSLGGKREDLEKIRLFIDTDDLQAYAKEHLANKMIEQEIPVPIASPIIMRPVAELIPFENISAAPLAHLQ